MPAVLVFLVTLLLLSPASSFADDLMRVLVVQDAQRVDVFSERGVAVQLPNGEARVFAGAIVVGRRRAA